MLTKVRLVITAFSMYEFRRGCLSSKENDSVFYCGCFFVTAKVRPLDYVNGYHKTQNRNFDYF